MRLAELAARLPGGRLATPDDNASILAFFDRAATQTSAFALRYRRSPDFFRLLRYQGERAHVILAVDERGDVVGLSSISLRPAWVDGVASTVGYLGDLRIGMRRALVASWRSVMADVVGRSREIEELADCSRWLTAILDDNQVARRALQSGRAGAPTCVPIAAFTMRNVVARLPLARLLGRRSSSPWRARYVAPADEGRLAEFYEARQRALPCGFRGELERRLTAWDGLRASDFIIVTEGDGDTIVGCAAPWAPWGAKQIHVSRLPTPMRLLERASRLLPLRNVRVPRAGDPLRIAYLTHLTFAAGLQDVERRDVFRVVLDHVFDRWRDVDWHCLAIADFADWDLGRAMAGYVQSTVPITVYAVTPGGKSHEGASEWCSRGPPAFEIATV